MEGWSGPAPGDTTLPPPTSEPKEVAVHSSYRKRFNFPGKLYCLCVVDKVAAKNGKLLPRMLLCTRDMVILCELGGTMKSVNNIWDVERVVYRDVPGGNIEFLIRFTDPQEQCLRFRPKEANKWYIPMVLNTLRYALTNPPFQPLPITKAEDEVDMVKRGSIRKNPSRAPRKKTKYLTSPERLQETKGRLVAAAKHKAEERMEATAPVPPPLPPGTAPDFTLQRGAAEQLGLSLSPTMVIESVEAGSPADRGGAGAHIGSKVTHVGGTPVGSFKQLRKAMEDKTVLPFHVNRTHSPQSATAAVPPHSVASSAVPRSPSPPPQSISSPQPPSAHPASEGKETDQDQIVIRKQPSEAFGLTVSEDLVIKRVHSDSASSRHGAKRFLGKKLKEVNGEPVSSIGELGKVLGEDRNMVSIKVEDPSSPDDRRSRPASKLCIDCRSPLTSCGAYCPVTGLPHGERPPSSHPMSPPTSSPCKHLQRSPSRDHSTNPLSPEGTPPPHRPHEETSVAIQTDPDLDPPTPPSDPVPPPNLPPPTLPPEPQQVSVTIARGDQSQWVARVDPPSTGSAEPYKAPSFAHTADWGTPAPPSPAHPRIVSFARPSYRSGPTPTMDPLPRSWLPDPTELGVASLLPPSLADPTAPPSFRTHRPVSLRSKPSPPRPPARTRGSPLRNGVHEAVPFRSPSSYRRIPESGYVEEIVEPDEPEPRPIEYLEAPIHIGGGRGSPIYYPSP